MAIAVVPSASVRNSYTADASWDLAFGASVGDGDLLIVVIEETSDETTTITSVSDDVNGAWTLIEGPLDHTNVTMRSWWYYFQNSASGTPTVTVAFSGAINGHMGIAAFSGAATSGGPDAVGTPRVVGSGITTHTSNTVALSGAGAIISGLLLNSQQSITPTGGETNVTNAASRAHIMFTQHASGTTLAHEATSGSAASTQVIAAWLEAGAAVPLSVAPIMQNYRNMGLLH